MAHWLFYHLFLPFLGSLLLLSLGFQANSVGFLLDSVFMVGLVGFGTWFGLRLEIYMFPGFSSLELAVFCRFRHLFVCGFGGNLLYSFFYILDYVSFLLLKEFTIIFS